MSNIEEVVNLKEISERFNNGTETIEDIMNYCRNYEIKFRNGPELRVVEKRYFDKLVERIKELEEINTANRKVIVEQCDYIQNKSIPVQKVKDILKELNQEYIKIDKSIDIHKKSDDRGKVDCLQMISWLEGKLEELLEDK